MLSVVDETDDDWQAITALGSWAEFDAFFAEKYIDSECFAAGCTVVVTNADGVVHRRRFGGHKDGSIFCVYSVTKIVTTIACLQLRDAGKLRLDDPLSTHLPYWLDEARPTEEAGIAWWVGMGSTCFGFHPEAKVGVLVYGTHASPLGGAMGGKGRKTTTRLGAFRDTINAAFHLDRQ